MRRSNPIDPMRVSAFSRNRLAGSRTDHIAETWVEKHGKRWQKIVGTRKGLLVVALLIFCLFLEYFFLETRKPGTKGSDIINSSQQLQRTVINNPSSIKCPLYEAPDNANAESYDASNGNWTEVNTSEYLKSFRSKWFDRWRLSYSDLKAKKLDFKSRAFASVKNGDTIYESACGIGLNLFMTLEILQEVHGVTNLTVYGNDHTANSVRFANTLMDAGLLTNVYGRKGRICQGDSTNLSFVPSNTFDVVFTGFITPDPDPLHSNLSWHDVRQMYSRICEGGNPEFQVLRSSWKRAQEQWFSKWVKEIVRIGKPGALIVVESVVAPFCDNRLDFGGVSKEFWQETVTSGSEWDVDPLSLIIGEDTVFDRRYHVSMRKKQNLP